MMKSWVLRYLQKIFFKGSWPWLIVSEMKYGGIVEDVPRNIVSKYDPRSREQLAAGGMIGGDRMYHHGYCRLYAQYLKPFVGSSKKITLAEFGILRGTGLAIWCDLFPAGRVLGFDIDLNHMQNNEKNLFASGAFKDNRPELYVFDQFEEDKHCIKSTVGADSIDICIDDGFHSDETIVNTLSSVYDCLADEFVYFIEDNSRVAPIIRSAYPGLTVFAEKGLTVLKRAGTR